MTTKPFQHSLSLNEVVDAWQRTLHFPDPGGLVMALATVVANRLEGDPVRMMLIGPPSSGKTEIVDALSDLPEIHVVSTMTKAGLLTGSPSKEGTGGLLRQLGIQGIIAFPDFTSLLSEHGSTRNEVFGILREVHDGRVHRALGTAGGKVIKWRGRAGAIACVTEAVDAVDMAALGERWLRYRLPPLGADGRFRAGVAALANQDRQQANRELRREVVTAFLSELTIPTESPGLTDDEVNRLAVLADLATRCRSAVVRGGGHHDEIILVPAPEETPRLIGALGKISAGLWVIGMNDEWSWRLISRCALDGMHALRRRVLDVLLATSVDYSTSTVAGHCALPQSTARRHLEDLTALGVVEKIGDFPERWAVSPWLRERWWATTQLEPTDG